MLRLNLSPLGTRGFLFDQSGSSRPSRLHGERSGLLIKPRFEAAHPKRGFELLPVLWAEPSAWDPPPPEFGPMAEIGPFGRIVRIDQFSRVGEVDPFLQVIQARFQVTGPGFPESGETDLRSQDTVGCP